MSMYANASTESLKRRLAELDSSPSAAPSAPEYSLGERGLQASRGLASATGGTLDFLAKAAQNYLNPLGSEYIPMAEKMLERPFENPEEEAERQSKLEALQQFKEKMWKPQPTHLRESAEEAIDKLAGRSLKPTDIPGKIAHGFGEFMEPMPFSGYGKAYKAAKVGAKEGAKALGKVLGKEATMATGASAALSTPQISEEGSALGTAENIGKAILGSKVASSPLGTLKNIAKIPGKTFEGLKNIPAKIMSLGTEPNKEVFGLAEKHGVELPSNVGMGGKGGTIQNWLHNNFLKSIFVSKQYKDTIHKADQSMIDAVKHNIDTLGPSQLKPFEASGDYQRLLREQEKEAEQVAGSLYDKASTLLSPKDKVVPRNTLDSLESMRELVDRDIKSPATKKVVKILADLSESWGINPQEMGFKDYKSLQAALKNDPKMGTIILDAMGRKPTPISIERLNGVRKELGTITGHDPDIKGVEAYLNRLKGDITKDIESSTNQEFVGAWKEANKFFKQNVADRFRTDMARSLMTGEMPKDAFSLMSNAKTIRELERIAGESPKSKEVFDSLKKSKVQEIFAGALQGEEKLGVGNFINLFKTGKQKETLAALLPHQSYNNMIELRKIAQEYQKSGRDLLNTSGTAWVTADVNRVETLAKAGLAAFFGSSAAGLPGALIAPATPILLSRMVSNPEIVKKARAYALARMNGNEKGADNIMKQLLKMSEKDAKAALVAAQQSTKEKEE